MTDHNLDFYMLRAGIRSRRELSRLAGIAPTTLTDIFKHPGTARAYTLAKIAKVCGMDSTEVGEFIQEVTHGKT